MQHILRCLALLSEYTIERMPCFPSFGFSFSWTCLTRRFIYPHESQSRFMSIKLLITVLDAIVVAGSASLECRVLE